MPPIEVETDETERTQVEPVESNAELAAAYWRARANNEGSK